jgi:hypothetical protein
MQNILLSSQQDAIVVIFNSLKTFGVNMFVGLHLRWGPILTERVVVSARFRPLLKGLNSLYRLAFPETSLRLLHFLLLDRFLDWQCSCWSHSPFNRLDYSCRYLWQLKFTRDMLLCIGKYGSDCCTLIVILRHSFFKDLEFLCSHLVINWWKHPLIFLNLWLLIQWGSLFNDVKLFALRSYCRTW